MKKKFNRMLSICLTVLLIITSIPMQVLANESSKLSSNEVEKIISDFNETQKPCDKVISESLQKRDEYSKTYVLENGNYCNIIAATPIHYLDENNDWKDIYDDLSEVPQNIEKAEENISNAVECTQSDIEIVPFSTTSNNTIENNENITPISITGESLTESNNSYSLNLSLNQEKYVTIKQDIIDTYSAKNYALLNVSLSLKIKNGSFISTVGLYEGLLADGVLDSNSKKLSTLSLPANSEKEYSFDITSTYIKLERNVIENNGFVFSFASLMSNVSISNPCIAIEYKDYNNENVTNTNHMLDLGEAGSLYINDVTNTIQINQNLIGLDVNAMPVNISRYMSSCSPSLNVTSSLSGNWNYNSNVYIDNNIFYWKTLKGDTIQFSASGENTTNGYNIWTQINDDIVSYATLYIDDEIIESDGLNADYENCYIEDSGYKYYFNSNGQISSITDGTNSISIKYGSLGTINKITDGEKHSYNFTYDNFTVDGIKYPYVKHIVVKDKDKNTIVQNDKNYEISISITYDENTELITCTETLLNGEQVSYIYNKFGRLNKINCCDGSCLELNYNDSSLNDNYLVSYNLTDNDGKIIDSLNINYIGSQNVYTRKFDKQLTDSNIESEYYYYNHKYELITHKSSDNNISCFSYDEDGNVYAYASPEKESILDNPHFETNPISDNSWSISNNSFFNHNNSIITLSPSTSSVTVNQLIGKEKIELDLNSNIVVGITGKLNSGYRAAENQDTFCGAYITAIYKDYEPDVVKLELDNTLVGEWQTVMSVLKLKENCLGLIFSIAAENICGSVEFENADLFLGDASGVIKGIYTSDISESDSYSCEYNDNEKIINEKITQGDMFLAKSYQYNDNQLTSETDHNGITTYYEYDSVLNNLSKSGNVLDENGNIKNPTEYAYNANNLLEGINATITSINEIGNSTSTVSLNALYDYNTSNRITSVTNNGTTYSFNYFVDGNIESISVSGQNDDETSNQKLQQYEYNSNTNINKIVYGNGSEITYTYQNDKIDTVNYYNTNNSESSALLKFNYSYDDNGEVSSVICYATDVVSNIEVTSKTKIVYTDNGYELYDFVNENENETERLIYSTSGDLSSNTETYFVNADESFFEQAETSFSSNKANNNTTDIMNFNMEKGLLASSTHKIGYNMQSVIEKDSFGRIVSNNIDRSYINHQFPDDNGKFNYNVNYSYESLNSESGQTSSLLSEYKITGDIMGDSSLPELAASTIFKYDSRGNLQFKYYKLDESINCQNNNQCSCKCDSNSKQNCSESAKCCDECSCPLIKSTYILGNYYGYDEQNQLVCEANPLTDKYYTYTYDASGNLCTKRAFYETPSFKVSDNPDFSVYELITMEEDEFKNFDFSKFKNSLLLMDAEEYYEYTYSFDPIFKDRMIGYAEKKVRKNNDEIESETIINEKIKYDGCGNPLNYIGYNYEGLVRAKLKWCGNLLTEFDMLDDNGEIIRIFTYEYDQNGYRTAKKKYLKNTEGVFVLCSEQDYVWENGVLQGIIFKGNIYDYLEEKKSSYSNIVTFSKIIYDSEGSPIGYVTPTGFMHQYVKDAQGNVIGLQVTGDGDGIALVEMSYDSWGQLTLGNIPDPNQLGYNSFMLTALFNPCTYKGYLYDYESGMYYAKSECYSPTWARNISTDGDYSGMMHASSNPLDSNPYLFCNNNLISNNDIYSSWSTHDSGLTFFDSGFELYANKGFLSRPLCELYAAQLIKDNGTYNYDIGANLYGMDRERIATNLFSNAVGYYSPKAINKVNANWGLGWLDSLSKTMNGKIVIRNNEKEYIVNNYKQIWLAAPTIKNYAWSNGIFITV